MRVNHVLMHNEMCNQFAMSLRLVIDERKRELADLEALLVSVVASGNPTLDLGAVITNDEVKTIRTGMGHSEETPANPPIGGTLVVQPKGQLQNGAADTPAFVAEMREAREKAAREGAEAGPKDLDAPAAAHDEDYRLTMAETGV